MVFQRIRDWYFKWSFARKTKKVYLERLSKHHGIPLDKLKGLTIGKLEESK